MPMCIGFARSWMLLCAVTETGAEDVPNLSFLCCAARGVLASLHTWYFDTCIWLA
jgi:hypothetical protein